MLSGAGAVARRLDESSYEFFHLCPAIEQLGRGCSVVMSQGAGERARNTPCAEFGRLCYGRGQVCPLYLVGEKKRRHHPCGKSFSAALRSRRLKKPGFATALGQLMADARQRNAPCLCNWPTGKQQFGLDVQ